MPLWIQMLIVCAIPSERLKAPGLQRTILSNRGLCVAGQWFLWLVQPLELLGKRQISHVSPLRFSVLRANECQTACSISTGHCNSRCMHGRRQQRQGGSLTEFCGGYCDVVPRVCLSVQRFCQGDLPVVEVDVELPLQVRVPINGVPAKVRLVHVRP